MAESLRVLQVLGSSAGGVARHVRQLVDALGAPAPGGPAWSVHVAGPASLAADLTGPGGGFHAVEIADRPRGGDVTAVRRLRALASAADVVHAHGLRAGALTVLATRGPATGRRPLVVVTLHNLPVGGRALRTVSGVLERVVARGADVVLGVSGDLVARARSLGAARTERAIVPAPPRPATQADPRRVRADLGVAPGEHLVVTVARLAPQKGLDTLLDAAGQLLRQRTVRPATTATPPATARAATPPATTPPDDTPPDDTPPALWVVAGDGPLHDRLAHRIADERLPVRLLGRRGDVPDLLAAADVVVSTAVWEGQPIAIQEALQLGAPVVATDAGGTREVTGDAGAVLVPVGDAAALASEVGRLLVDPEARVALAHRALDRAAGLPGVPDVVDQLRRVYAR